MRTGIIVIVIIAFLVVLGVGGWFLYQRQQEATPDENTNTNSTSVNAEPLEPEPISGDKEVAKTLTYNSVNFELTSALTEPEAFGQDTAPEGKDLVIVFLKPLNAQVTDVLGWIGAAAKLRAGDKVYSPVRIKLLGEGDAATVAGYLLFAADEGTTGFRLTMGEGEGSASVDLGF